MNATLSQINGWKCFLHLLQHFYSHLLQFLSSVSWSSVIFLTQFSSLHAHCNRCCLLMKSTIDTTSHTHIAVFTSRMTTFLHYTSHTRMYTNKSMNKNCLTSFALLSFSSAVVSFLRLLVFCDFTDAVFVTACSLQLLLSSDDVYNWHDISYTHRSIQITHDHVSPLQDCSKDCSVSRQTTTQNFS